MKKPNYDSILKRKIGHYGESKSAYEFAASEFALESVKYSKMFGDSADLLEKYIAHVSNCEGCNFIDKIHKKSDDIHFNDTELLILKSLNNEH